MGFPERGGGAGQANSEGRERIQKALEMTFP